LLLDIESQRVVIQFRDADSGEVTSQFPSERQLEAYKSTLRRGSDEPNDLLAGKTPSPDVPDAANDQPGADRVSDVKPEAVGGRDAANTVTRQVSRPSVQV
jgi:hypothetical protein